MNEQEFLNGFHNCTLSELRHKDHVRLAWLILTGHKLKEAYRFISEGLKCFAASRGSSSAYHESITLFWLMIVNHCLQRYASKNSDFEEFLAAYPMLLDRELMYRHWHKETILSNEARKVWISPDILPMP